MNLLIYMNQTNAISLSICFEECINMADQGRLSNFIKINTVTGY